MPEDRKKIRGGGASFNLEPQASPVSTYYRPQEAPIEKPIDMSGLAQSINSAINTGVNINEFLKIQAEKKAQEIYYNQTNKLAWKEAIKNDPTLKSWNPYVDDYYEKVRAKNKTDEYFADLQSDKFIRPDMTVSEASQVIDQKNLEYINFMKEQGFTEDIITEHFQDLENFKQKRIYDHAQDHLKVRTEQNKAQTIYSINTELYNAEDIVLIADTPEVSRGNLFTQILEAGATDYIQEGFGSEAEAGEMIFNAVKYHLGERVTDDSFSPDELIKAAKDVKVNGKTISEIIPGYKSKIEELSQTFKSERLKVQREAIQMEKLRKEQIVEEIEGKMYAAMSTIDPKDVKGITQLQKEMVAVSIKYGVAQQIGNLTSSLKKYVNDTRDLNKPTTDEEVMSHLFLGAITGKTSINDVALAYNNGLLSPEDFRLILNKKYEVIEDSKRADREERNIRLQAMRQNIEIGRGTITTNVTVDPYDLTKDEIIKSEYSKLNAEFTTEVYKEVRAGGDGSRAVNNLSKKIDKFNNKYNPVKPEATPNNFNLTPPGKKNSKGGAF